MYEPKLPLLLERDMVLYDPWDAIKLQGEEAVKFRKTSGHGITLRVYGTIGISDLTGKETIDDMQVMLGAEDITNELPESLLLQFVEDAIENQ